MTRTYLVGDVVDRMREIPDGSVDHHRFPVDGVAADPRGLPSREGPVSAVSDALLDLALRVKSVLLEDTLNARRDALGKDHVYLTRFGRPLNEVFANTQLSMLDDWNEDDGHRCGDRCDT